MSYRIVYVAVIGMCVSYALSQESETLSARDILTAYEGFLQLTGQRVAFDSRTEEVYEGAYDWELQPRKRVVKAVVRRDAGRLDSSALEERSHESNARSQRTSVHRSRQILLDDQGMRYRASGEDPPNVLLVDSRSGDRFAGGIAGLIGEGRLLDGYVPGDPYSSLPEAMGEGELRLRDDMELVDGHWTYVLECVNRHGKKIVWIDPKAGFGPRRIVMRVAADDLYGDVPLGTPPEPLPDGMKSKEPMSAALSQEIVVDAIKIEKIDGAFVSTGMQAVVSRSYANGASIVKTVSHTRENMKLNPEFGSLGAFTMDVPDGTPVHYLDSRRSGLAYEWFDGEIRPLVDEEAIQSIDRLSGGMAMEVTRNTELEVASTGAAMKPSTPKQASARPQSRNMMIPVVGAGIAALVALIWYIRRARRQGEGQ